MMAFLQYAMQVVFSFLMLSMTFIILPRASVSGNRVAEVLKVEPSVQDPPSPKKFAPGSKGVVEFRNVGFRYPGAEENLLCGISFTAKPGETTAIIGSTGSGKSTVVNLIPRFFDVTEGAIYVDGLDVREVSQRDLRDRIGYIPQKGMLFSGTVESNLRYADEDASPEVIQNPQKSPRQWISLRKWMAACRLRSRRAGRMFLGVKNSAWLSPVRW